MLGERKCCMRRPAAVVNYASAASAGGDWSYRLSQGARSSSRGHGGECSRGASGPPPVTTGPSGSSAWASRTTCTPLQENVTTRVGLSSATGGGGGGGGGELGHKAFRTDGALCRFNMEETGRYEFYRRRERWWLIKEVFGFPLTLFFSFFANKYAKAYPVESWLNFFFSHLT